MLQVFRDMHVNGYLDPEFSSTSWEQAMQKFASNKFGMLNRNADANWLESVIVKSFWAANPEIENPFDVIGVIPALALNGESPVQMEKYIDMMCATQIAATVDDDKLRRYLEFHEFCMGEEGNLLKLGFEGIDWERKDGKVVKIRDANGLAPNLAEKYPSLPVMSMPSWGFEVDANPEIETFDHFNDEVKQLNQRNCEIRNKDVVASDMRVRLISDQALLDANAFKFSTEYANLVTGRDDLKAMFEDMVNRAMNDGGFEDAIRVVNEIVKEKGWD